MGLFLGIDTSNYTTSTALYDSSNDTVTHSRKLLPVREGELGLRQSDAVFAHVKQLPEVINSLLGDKQYKFDGVGYSARPRDVEGSYMPCFLVGEMLAKVLANQSSAPLYDFSHQAGHVAAALYSANRLDLLRREFVAFHFSGGTTEGLLVRPHRERIMELQQISGTLDLNAGQVVDRVGGMLGLAFPAGKELEKLALTCETDFPIRIKLKGMNCCLSGVENQCRDMLAKGAKKNEVAKYCLDTICATVQAMSEAVMLESGDIPRVYAGGVTSNSLIRSRVSQWLGGVFATPELSSDNAVGVALLAYLKAQGSRLC
ncbi:peptidase M22 [Hydrogenoanaerobacterium sp.]|uniref:peptidase M22 n=1 Tax=Hydrogenoanaerobacterium sp. TaxID=2953763 RepID=UPI0028A2D5AD|nr:peptidase M22 [Hydrogenoanaerobacterium sp.]